ncbi:MAG: NAD(P)-dependent oxidoreductase [Cyanomargarita calcarea GSE-NOS-MK-12-04C]|uniref:NAD(P)-dependent oxidoreductase n=1 Tax=Cyanomargarita calcarea GSE-NOS-MK-12-04C TaxID=2839659 RepID=A0A951QVJ7_9CYAN|nr:NAD(P)-dependent oxidoreductase [Cyanomargarita calcarea GSE-NOS-MK-12-04C]
MSVRSVPTIGKRRVKGDREEIWVVDDQIGAPIWSRRIAFVKVQILAQASGNVSDFLQGKGGLYHLIVSRQTSWYCLE